MKTTYTLPPKKTETIGVFKTQNQAGTNPSQTSSTDTTSILSLSTTHMFNR